MSDPTQGAGATPPEIRLNADDAQRWAAAADRARTGSWAKRLFDRDPTLWSSDPAVQAGIADRLGWLDAPKHFSEQIPALEGFGEGLRADGFQAAVVAGMGGSSLAPEVLLRTFGVAPGWLELRVLDSTDPVAVGAVVDDLDPLATLFVVASKSGTTTEPLAFQADAWARIRAALDARHEHSESPGFLIAAISDPGKSIGAIPHHDELREVFLNPPDIGGRYSALTYVGLVPASVIGLSLTDLLASASGMLTRCQEPEPAANPGVALGLALGSLALAAPAGAGRDKVTFIADPEIASLGSWLEQLIAESTGKQGVGIVPVDLEPLGAASAYGPDRVFVRLALAGSAGPAPAPDGTTADELVEQLATAGHPVIRIELADRIDIGAEFIRWEVATAIAGAVLGIDAFDQPNVEEAKILTRELLARHGQAAEAGLYEAPPPPIDLLAAGDGLALIGDAALNAAGPADTPATVEAVLRRHLDRAKPNAYLCLQAYIAPSPERDAALARIRTLLRDRTGRATTSGYGPRFLHSTGQLHKGGAPLGLFFQLTADHPQDREIPDWPYTFGQLIDAQAAGDFGVLESHQLPVLRVHLEADPDAGLAALERALDAVLAGS
jgi:transaldolase/glucose-6-phosphate isomerase